MFGNLTKRVSLVKVDRHKRDAAKKAARDGDTQRLREIIRAAGSHPNMKVDDDRNTPLHLAGYQGHLETVQMLCREFPIKINAKARMNITPLMWTVSGGHTDCVRYLLAQPGVDVNVRDQLGQCAADWARGNRDLLELLENYEEIADEFKEPDGITFGRIRTVNHDDMETLMIQLHNLQEELDRVRDEKEAMRVEYERRLDDIKKRYAGLQADVNLIYQENGILQAKVEALSPSNSPRISPGLRRVVTPPPMKLDNGHVSFPMSPPPPGRPKFQRTVSSPPPRSVPPPPKPVETLSLEVEGEGRSRGMSTFLYDAKNIESSISASKFDSFMRLHFHIEDGSRWKGYLTEFVRLGLNDTDFLYALLESNDKKVEFDGMNMEEILEEEIGMSNPLERKAFITQLTVFGIQEETTAAQFDDWIGFIVGLPEYVRLFRRNGITNVMSIFEATHNDLSDLGITIRYHRTRILWHVAKLGRDEDSESIGSVDDVE